MHDISTSADIRVLVDNFYKKVVADDVIGYIFNEVAKVNWPHHLPRMYAFWEFLLLDLPVFQGNPIEPHMALHQREPLRPEHFDRWLLLFQTTVDEFFEGEIAEKAKTRAYMISETWKPKFEKYAGVGLLKKD